eukprot:8885885-Prorocentrum_lima.AAC.1
MAEPDYFFDPDKEEEFMNEAKETAIPQTGEAEPLIKGKDQFEEDQLLNVLHGTSMPVLEEK